MSEINKINTGVAKNVANHLANHFKANVDKNVVTNIGASELSKIKTNEVTTESMDLNLDNITSSFEIQKISKDEYHLSVDTYKDKCEQELEEYNKALVSISEELEELSRVEPYIQGANFLEANFPDDASLNSGVEKSSSLERMNAIVKEKTKFNSYQEYKNYVDNLKNDKNILGQAIRKTEELKECAIYTFMPYLESYQQYDNAKTFTLQDVNDKSVNMSPLQKFETLTNFYSRYNIKIDRQDKLEALSNASKYAPELSKMYNYLYETEGLDSATTYLEKMESTINQVNGKAKAEKFLEHLEEEENPLDAVGNHLKTGGKGLTDGAESFFEGIAAWFKSSDIYTSDEYESMYILEALQNNPNYDKLLDNNYEISQSIGNMLPSIAISLALSPVAGAEMAQTAATVSMGVSAGGKSYHSSLVEGQSTLKAVSYGVLSGLSEAGLEKVMGGISGISDVNVTNLKTFAQSMLKEGIEEGTQEYADALLRTGIFGESFDLEEITKNAGKSALYGAITAGIMNSPTLAVNEVKQIKQNQIQGNLSKTTLEFLDSVKNKETFKLKTEDGKVYTYNELLELAASKELNSIIKSSLVEGNNVVEVGEKMIDNTLVKLQNGLNQNVNVTKAILGALLSPFDTMKRFLYSNVSSNTELSQKILNEGLYHITSLESAQKILESGYIKKSGFLTSYGAQKTFFFAGEPSLNEVSQNISNFEQVRVAIKLDVDEVQLRKLIYRKLSDKAIAKFGDYSFSNDQAHLAYLGLKEENGKLVYKEISKSEYDNYQSVISSSNVANIMNDIKSLMIALSSEYDSLSENVNDFLSRFGNDSESYDYIMSLFEEIQKEKENLHKSKVLLTSDQVKEQVNNFNLENFLNGKTENRDGLFLFTPSQTIMTETFYTNGNFQNTAEAIMKTIDTHFEKFTNSWLWDKSLQDTIIMETSSGITHIFLPSIINEQQYSSLEAFYSKVNSNQLKTGVEPNFSFARTEGGLEVLHLALEEAKRRVGDVKKNKEEIILSENSVNENIINISSFNKVESVQLANKIELNQEKFNSLSVLEQQKYIENANLEQVDNIVEDPSSFNPTTIEQLKQKILQNEEAFFLGRGTMERKNNIDAFAVRESSLLQNLKNESLISLLNSRVSQEVIQEVYKRIDNGDILFDRLTFVDNCFGMELKDSQVAFFKLSDEYQQKVVNLVREKYNQLPLELQELSRSGNSGLFSQAFFITSYLNGNIDSEGIRILNELKESSPQKLQDVNYNLLNKEFVNDLGEEYLKIVMNDPLKSSKIVSLHDNFPNVYQAFLNILHESKQDNSLFTFYPKTNKLLNFMFKNAQKLSSLQEEFISNEGFVNYALYEEDINYNRYAIQYFEYSSDYQQKFEQLCNENFLEAYQHKNDFSKMQALNEAKEAYFSKYFSTDYQNIKKFISKYGTSLENIKKYDKNAATLLLYLKYVDSIDDFDMLKNVFDTEKCKLTSEEMLHMDNSLRRAYAMTYIDSLSKTDEKIKGMINKSNMELVDSNGKEIKVLEINEDFSFIVRSSDSGLVVENKGLVENSYKKSWEQSNSPTNHILAASYITSENIGSCPVIENGVLYGFTNLDESKIVMMGPADINSHINSIGYTSGQDQVFVSANEMSKYTTRIYNEVDLEMNGVTPNYIIIYEDFDSQLLSNAYKAAAEWDVPIIKLDKTKLAIQQAEKINTYLNDFKVTSNIESLKQALDLYEANSSGYKLNAIENEEAIDRTAVINNKTIKDLGLFDSVTIENDIMDYIHNLTKMENNVSLVDELIDVCQTIQDKYELTNVKFNNNLLANTKSNIDYDTIINILNENRK